MTFRQRIAEELSQQGMKFFRETVWSSSLQRVDLPRVRKLLATNGFEAVDVTLFSPMDDSAFRMRWATHYLADGQCVSAMVQVPILKNSNHLKLTFGYPDKDTRESSRPKMIVVANALRLVFGVPVARELIQITLFGENEEPTTQSDEGFASVFDTQEINLFNDPAIEDAALIHLPEEAAFLLDKAFGQAYPGERFILMWLAFETIINAVIANGRNGQKREAYFRGELGSDIANAEVHRLFKLRCDLFKEGRLINSNSIEDDCWALYAALQLAVMKESELRRAFLSGFELKAKEREAARIA
ncbi:hypothetical protein [uncultured Aquitalea sp.]|uniref:hypothetical protein n=1 Tax=uncultured Aquitalea sp. TaxID=540272 RepID=UPI0025FB2786|nr:hypothetical protein [uncultured Aquitalea sp.]